jgi:hypothetical protein
MAENSDGAAVVRYQARGSGHLKVGLILAAAVMVTISQGKWWLLTPAAVVAGLVWWEHNRSYVDIHPDGVEIHRAPIDTGAFVHYGDIIAIERGRGIGKRMFPPALVTEKDGTVRLPSSIDGPAIADVIDERIQQHRRSH